MRTAERIREQFWWPNLDRDVARHVQECVTCQATSNKDAPHHAQHDTFPLARGPNQRLHVDLFGPIKDREGRPKYILGMTDAFTKILRLKAIDSKSAAEVAMAIWTDWMAIYGIPQTIMSDNGKEFVNKLQSSILKLLQVEQRTTTPYHPVCNQMQEHQNRALAHYLRCALRDAEKSTIEWEYYLPALMLSHNTAVNAATRQSPFTTMFGYNPRLPLWPDLSKVLTQGDFDLPPAEKDVLYGWLDSRKSARKAAYDANVRYQDRQERSLSPMRQSFKAGQAVWSRIQVSNDANKKFGAKWEKAEIVERMSLTTYRIMRLGVKRNKFKTTNVEHLKPRTAQTDTDGPDDVDHGRRGRGRAISIGRGRARRATGRD